MTLDPRRVLLAHDQFVSPYTASSDLGDSGRFFSTQSVNHTDTDNSDPQLPTDSQGQLGVGRPSHLIEPASLNSNLKRGRGRPKSDPDLKRKRRKAPPKIAPKRQASDETLPESNYRRLSLSEPQIVEESFQALLDIPSLAWTVDDTYPFYYESDISVTSTPGPSTSTVNREVNTQALVMRRTRRPPLLWEVRIDPAREIITSLNILMNSVARNTPPWVRSARVLLSKELRRSYIYEDYLDSLGYTWEPMKVWKTTYHLGQFAPISLCPVHVTNDANGQDEPFLIEFCVLPGAKPPGGVDFMIGEPMITAMYGQGWRPDSPWSPQQYV